jgi:hypothetical protein
MNTATLTEGPLGFPLQDRQAFALEAILKALPQSADYAYRKAVAPGPPTEVNPGERSDVSWISTEAIDRDREIVRARGLNESVYQYNPIVTLGHRYDLPPVGRSLWRKRARDGDTAGVKAKTQYPPRPGDWPEPVWTPDAAFTLVQSGLMSGKSIGFLPVKFHVPSSHEIAQKPELQGVARIIDEWLLLEYACTWLPTNAQAIVEAVSKGFSLPAEIIQALGLSATGQEESCIPFTPLTEIERRLVRKFESLDVAGLIDRAITDHLDRMRGRV